MKTGNYESLLVPCNATAARDEINALTAQRDELAKVLKRMLADVEAWNANPNGHSSTSCIAQAHEALAKL
jgi:hypothetical protein